MGGYYLHKAHEEMPGIMRLWVAHKEAEKKYGPLEELTESGRTAKHTYFLNLYSEMEEQAAEENVEK